MNSNLDKMIVPGAKEAIEKMKYELSNEIGNLDNADNTKNEMINISNKLEQSGEKYGCNNCKIKE